MLGRFISLFFCLIISLPFLKANTEQELAIDNFVLTDLNGQKYELDQLMMEGKHVILNFGTTWAPSSWNYEKTEALSNVKKLNSISGRGDLIVLFLEADLNTDVNCLKGNENCNYSSMGNWTQVIDYPIIDLTEEELNFLRKYKIDEYPTVYGIKPDRKISSLGQADMGRILSWMEGTPYAYNVPSSINVSTNLVAASISKLSDYMLQRLIESNSVLVPQVEATVLKMADTNDNSMGRLFYEKYISESYETDSDVLSGLQIIALAAMDTDIYRLGVSLQVPSAK
jgi:hypothetical protein